MRELDRIDAQLEEASSTQGGVTQPRLSILASLWDGETEGCIHPLQLSDGTVVHQALELHIGRQKTRPHGFLEYCPWSLRGLGRSRASVWLRVNGFSMSTCFPLP